MFSFKNFSQLALILQNIESLDLYSDEKSFFVKTELGRAKDGLREMKKAREILESLCADLTSAITEVTARIMPAARHHGLNELPDEILADILVRNTSNDPKTVCRYRDLNLVNKRFRSIVSSTPLCWSHLWIHERGKSEMCKHSVMRNGSLPIDCTMSDETLLPEFLKFKDRIRRIEWKFLRTVSDGTILDDERDLPSVKTLELDSNVDEDVFPHGWTFSQLTSLRSDGYFPTGPFPNLRRCILNLYMEYEEDDESYEPNTWITETWQDYNVIYKFLESTQSLESLSFPINGNTPLSGNEGKPKHITLINLRKLSLKCSPGKDNFLELLVCPRLETLEVELEACISEHFRVPMFDNPSLHMRISFMNVTNLSITSGTDSEDETSDEDGFIYAGGLKVCLYGIHRAFKRLKRLSIDGDLRIHVGKIKYEAYDRGLKDTLPLTSIYLRIPLKNHWDDLESIFEFYKRKNVDFKYVEVRDWHRNAFRKNHTAMKSLSSLFPNTNIYVDELKSVHKESTMEGALDFCAHACSNGIPQDEFV